MLWEREDLPGERKIRLIFPLTPEDLDTPDETLIRNVQMESFPEEYEVLKKGGTLTKNSKIWRLSPLMKDGIIPLDTRIKNADVPEERKLPTLLPARHYFVDLLAHHEHVKMGHKGLETILNNFRSKFWIIEGIEVVRRVSSECSSCILNIVKHGKKLTGAR